MLKSCAECGQQISTQARACPHCGNQPVNSCESCFHRCLSELEGKPCYSPHGVCPAFVHYMNGSLIELAEAKRARMHQA